MPLAHHHRNLLLCTGLVLYSAATACCQSKKTLQQIQLIEAAKEKRTAIQRKIDSQLLQAIEEYKGKKKPTTPPTEKVDVRADSSGNVAVDINAAVSDSLLQQIRVLGGTINYASKEYHSIRATIHLLQVETIAAWPEVLFIQPAVQAMNNNTMPLQ
jgi:7-keto-8-aminopelargonate synthetase-like enzyme